MHLRLALCRTYLSTFVTCFVMFGLDSACLAQQGLTWQENFPATSPAPRYAHALAYDSARSQTVLFGGAANGGVPLYGDTWIWDGTTWKQMFPVTSPSPRVNMAMAFDAARSEVVMFGGSASNAIVAETWTWDGSNWTQKFPPNSPPPSWNAQFLAYDAARAQVVFFGGGAKGNETWTWDGSNWTQLFPSSSPPARSAHTLAYDSLHQQVVLFGGSGVGDTFLGDTWVWDGSNWTQQSPSATPPVPRWNSEMAYDPNSGKVLLFGGGGPGGPIWGDTWAWDGNTWSKLFPPGSPSPRYDHGMITDSLRSTIVLWGGTDNISTFADTWTWVRHLFNICSLYDATKAVKSGSTLPIKLELCDASGNDLSSSTIVAHAVSIIQTSNLTSGAVQDAGNANPDNDFRYDPTLGSTGGYIFNLKTTSLTTGTYNVQFTVTGDSSLYAVPFQVK